MSTTLTGATQLAQVLLDPIVATLSGRGDLTPGAREAKARDLWAVIATCEPQDAIQTMLIGQCLLFNELIADGGKDVLAGRIDTLKPRAQSNVNALSRSLHLSIGTFLRLRDKSPAEAAPRGDVRETMEAAERGMDSPRKAPGPRADAEPPRQDSQKRRDTIQSDTPTASLVQSIANDTRTRPDIRPPHHHPAIDPRHAASAARPVVEPVPSWSNRIASPALADTA